MRSADRAAPLLAALDELSALADEDDQAALAAIRGRLEDSRLRVLVAGEAKRGKSTLINALLGRAVLPAGVTPLTALATTVRHGTDEGVTAAFGDGRTEQLPLEALHDLVTERGNPENCRRVASVVVTLDAPVLAHGVELVDTPGTGSVHAHNTEEAQAALKTMDAAVFVFTADPPASASERDLMSEVAKLAATIFVVLNKADYLTGPAGDRSPGPDELTEATEFTARIAAAATGRRPAVYPVSARSALAGYDAGFSAFADDFISHLDSRRESDLRMSAVGQVRRMAQVMLDEVDLTRRAAQLTSGMAAGRVGAFKARLEAVGQRRRNAADLAKAEADRMLADLNQAAGEAARQITAAVAGQLSDLIGGELRTARPADIERSGRDRLSQLAVAAADTWRHEQARRLEDGLAQVAERLAGDLAAELGAVRDAAADLLGLTLAVPAPATRLRPDLRFFYLAAEQAGQTELLAGAIRRRLPGEAGRRRARGYLDRETADVVPQQIGRARADLQYRLAEATRALIADISGQYSLSTTRLERALRAAEDQATAGQAAAADRRLQRRSDRLSHVMSLLAGE